MSEIDDDLAARYRAAPREEPPAHLDAAILAAAKRAVSAGPQPVESGRGLRRWYVPVSLAAVVMLSVIVTLRIEREQPQIAMPDAAPLPRVLETKQAKQLAEAPAAPPATAAPPPATAVPRAAPKAAAGPPAAPVFVPDPQPAREAAPQERQRDDTLRSAETANTASGSAAPGRLRSEARDMAAPAAQSAQPAALAKRELAPGEWLERIAELRARGRDAEADEQLAEFKRRHPDFTISQPMQERIAPRK